MDSEFTHMDSATDSYENTDLRNYVLFCCSGSACNSGVKITVILLRSSPRRPVNAALGARQWQPRALSFPLHLSGNAEHNVRAQVQFHKSSIRPEQDSNPAASFSCCSIVDFEIF